MKSIRETKLRAHTTAARHLPRFLLKPTMSITAAHPSPPNINNNRVIAFTTPENYAARLTHLIHLKNWTPLWCPTISVQSTPKTKSSLQHYLLPNTQSPLEDFSAIAFTSRAGILGFLDALTEIESPPLATVGDDFTISALGKDSELLDDSFIEKICTPSVTLSKTSNLTQRRMSNFYARIKVLVPSIATPSGMVEALGSGNGRRILCPVPLIVGLEEPPAVPNFIRDLGLKGWVPVRVDGYETRWLGPRCARAVVERSGGLDAVVFTSTGEVEGLLKSLREMGLEWEAVRKRWPKMVVAAHGPVTAAGAERLGVGVDVVSGRFGSFDGVVDALAMLWQ